MRTLLMQAPLQLYAKMLHEKVRRQRALQGANEVQTEQPGDEAPGAADEVDAAGEDELDVLQQLQEGKRDRKKEQRKQKKAVAMQPPPSVRTPSCILAVIRKLGAVLDVVMHAQMQLGY